MYSSTYTKLIQSINDNYEIDGIDDFNIIDASFIMYDFNHISLDSKKVLGIYRHMYNDSKMGFYSVPYVHRHNADGKYYPNVTMLKPRREVRETLLQKLHLSSSGKWVDAEYSVSEDYSPKKLIVDILNTQQAKSVPLPSQYVTGKWNEECVWEVFLLDNLKYFLPAFGSGIYMERHLICSPDDLNNLPSQVRNAIDVHNHDLLPHIEFRNDLGRMATIVVHFFNKWQGLVKWRVPYIAASDMESKDSNCTYNKLLMPGEKMEIVVKYDCGVRY